MSCPFLRDTRVRYCHASVVRKMIAAGAGDPAGELCSTPGYTGCRVFRDRDDGSDTAGARCPLLHETLVHYCAAAPVMKFIPFSEQAGRCGGDGFRFCELYLSLHRAGNHVSAPKINGLVVPEDLYFAPNHTWVYVGPNGACHLGIDSFYASVLGEVDRISFVTTSGMQRASAVLTVRGVDWPISYRNPMMISSAHVYLRSNPARLTQDPYGSGLLFEGWEMPDTNIRAGLLPGTRAQAWMELEHSRLDLMVHELAGRSAGSGPVVLNDGGAAAQSVLSELGREEILRMLHAFFAPDRGWEEESKH